MSDKINHTEKMKAKLKALKVGSGAFFTVTNFKDIRACYRAAEELGIEISRQANMAKAGWNVFRHS